MRNADIHRHRRHRDPDRTRLARLAARPATLRPPQFDDLLLQFRQLLVPQRQGALQVTHDRDQPHYRIAAPFNRGGQTGDAVGRGRSGNLNHP